MGEYGQFWVIPITCIGRPWDGRCFLKVENSQGERVILAEFAKYGDAVTAAKLFNHHVNVESVY